MFKSAVVLMNCGRCGSALPHTEEFFYRIKRWLGRTCRACTRAQAADWAARHPDRVKANRQSNKQNAYRQKRQKNAERWARTLVDQARRTTERKGWADAVELDEQYVLDLFTLQDGRCWWFDIPMVPSIVDHDPQRPSLDRLDNSRGYIKGNVVIACSAANTGRSSCEQRRFREFCHQLSAST